MRAEPGNEGTESQAPADQEIENRRLVIVVQTRRLSKAFITPLSGLPGSTGRTINLAGRETRIGRRKLHIDRAELRWLTGTPERGVAAELLQLLHRRAAGDLKRRPDRAGRHAVDPDAFRTQLLRQ